MKKHRWYTTINELKKLAAMLAVWVQHLPSRCAFSLYYSAKNKALVRDEIFISHISVSHLVHTKTFQHLLNELT